MYPQRCTHSMRWLARRSCPSVHLFHVEHGPAYFGCTIYRAVHTEASHTLRVKHLEGRTFLFRLHYIEDTHHTVNTHNGHHTMTYTVKGSTYTMDIWHVRTDMSVAQRVYVGMLFARLGVCQPTGDTPLIVLINASHWIGIYLKIMLDIFVRVRALRLVYRGTTPTHTR